MAGSRGNGSKASGKRIAAIERQRQALELRKAGASYDEIARALKYAGPQGAYVAVQSALKRTLQEPADDVRKLESERLNRLSMALWKRAIRPDSEGGPDLECLDRLMKIMARRAKLLGLDAPPKAAVPERDDEPAPDDAPKDQETGRPIDV